MTIAHPSPAPALYGRLQAAAAADGNGETMIVEGMGTAGFQAVFTGATATVNFEGTVNGADWVALRATRQSDGVVVTTTTASGVFFAAVAGLSEIRARISGWSAGTVEVVALATALGAGSGAGAASSGGGAATVADGADVNAGATTDAAVTTDAAGTLSGKLRGLVTLFVNLLSRWPAALGQGTMAQSLPVTLASNQGAVPVSAAALPLPNGAATDSFLNTVNNTITATGVTLDSISNNAASEATLAALSAQAGNLALNTTVDAGNLLLGQVNETAPASDTASGALNGRLQRIAQRLSSLIALIPAALGQGTMAQSLRVVLPSDQSSLPVAATIVGTPAVDTELTAVAALADAAANPTITNIASLVERYNGTTWDRMRNNSTLQVLSASARTATPAATAVVNYNHRGFVLFVNVTARAVATTLTPSLSIQDSQSGASLAVWTATLAINVSSGLTAYYFYPGAAVATPIGYAEKMDLTFPRLMLVNIAHSDGNSITYGSTISWIL